MHPTGSPIPPTARSGDPEGMTPVRSRASVATARPSPYLKQLSRHFGHKVDVVFDDERSTIPFAFGTAELRVAGDDELVIEATAGDAESLARVEQVIGSHLERFGRRDELSVVFAS
jgi:uncharacterized protein